MTLLGQWVYLRYLLGVTDPEGGLLQDTKTVRFFRTQFYTITPREFFLKILNHTLKDLVKLPIV